MNLDDYVRDQEQSVRKSNAKGFLESYNMGIARRLRQSELDMIMKTPQPNMMGGGMKMGDMYLPYEGDDSGTIATGGKKINRLKKSEQWSKFARDLVPKSVRKSAISRLNSEISGAGFDESESEDEYEGGKKINRLKKSEQWSKFARDLVPKSVRKSAISRLNSEISGGKKINRLKKSEQWSKFARDLIPKSTRQALVDRANKEISGAGKAKKPSAWIAHVKAYQKAHGISYKEAMSEARDSYQR